MYRLCVGMEAVGVVTAVGPGLTGRQVGDVVAYAGFPMGAYAEEQILPADKVVPVPSSIDPTVAASVLLKGMTAQFLLRRCFKVKFYSIFFFRYLFVFSSGNNFDPITYEWVDFGCVVP